MASYDQQYQTAAPHNQAYNPHNQHQNFQQQQNQYQSHPQEQYYQQQQHQQHQDYSSRPSNIQFDRQATEASQAPSHESTAAHQRKHSRGFSLSSNKAGSRKSENFETPAEKESRRLHTKADPSLAMNEAEPAAIAAMQATSMPSLRSIQHKDPFGNLIVEPDVSNPTRSRWERPLDTIRNFEAAIDGNYSTRPNYVPPSKETWVKRASIYSNPRDGNRGSYYGNSNNYSDSQQRPRNAPAAYPSYHTTGSGASGEHDHTGSEISSSGGQNYSHNNYSTQTAPQTQLSTVTPVAAPAPQEKRKSWFKKTFRK
ncbi:putative protein C19C7.04c [Ceratocystis platani]|uniref:Uncharacterized protein n=1 Tax=Ceratocystis fimbriata f. sp. platani TaxID=88771 RepID=A0A0F8BPU6_CERFI|nr:putative protein C19C7.04c [Ceratocystis platani]